MTLNSDTKFEYLTLWFQKWHEEVSEPLFEHSKSLKNCSLTGFLLSKV